MTDTTPPRGGRRILAIIPARGGSKGIERKNMVDVGGRPMIDWTLDAAAGIDCTSLVTTDDAEIAEHVRGKCDLVRVTGPNLHRDNSITFDAELDALEWVWRYERWQPDIVMRLQVTSPLRTAAHINECLGWWRAAGGMGAVVSVSPPDSHPIMAHTRNSYGLLAPCSTDDWQKPRQEYPEVWEPNGAIYAARLDYWRDNRGFFGPETFGWAGPDGFAAIDVDSAQDLFLVRQVVDSGQLNGRCVA